MSTDLTVTTTKCLFMASATGCLNSASAGLVRLEYSIYASTRSVCATPRAVKDCLPELFCLHIHGSTEMIIIFMVDKEALSGKDVY